ncbi:hypothetical protein GCM10009654_25650 [Streptomyces hebeiensis]|uniref:Uncharacterized protein n=1 Tax=Streptomyces hebeiensis TaxID=229486 RepID=A0ABN1UTN0_9ACTN
MVPKYRKNVVRDRPAAAAICSTVVLSKPRSAKSRKATSLTSARIAARVRSRSEERPDGAAPGVDDDVARSTIPRVYTDSKWYSIPTWITVAFIDAVPLRESIPLIARHPSPSMGWQ